MVDLLVEIAKDFDDLALTLAAIGYANSDKPDVAARVERARLRAVKGAQLARGEIERQRVSV